MTDKQIIIDGIDVRDCCEWYSLPDGKLYCRINNKGNFTCKSNPNCRFKQFARAKEENEKLKSQITSQDCEIYDLKSQLQVKKQECEKLKEGYSELTDIVSLYMDDFTGYNKELGGFDIVLCVKELMEQLDQLKQTNEELQKDNEELRKCYKNNLALLDFEETNTTKLVNKVMKLEKTLAEIKEIAEENIRIADLEGLNGVYRRGLAEQILQKINEVEINGTNP